MSQPHQSVSADPAKERRTANAVAAVIFMALLFDGYDLTVYGTVLSTLMKDPGQIGQLDAATAGALGSYALVGVLVGSLACGLVGARSPRLAQSPRPDPSPRPESPPPRPQSRVPCAGSSAWISSGPSLRTFPTAVPTGRSTQPAATS